MRQKLNLDFDILDGLRGIAALYVVINHCRGNMLIGGTELSQLVPIDEWSITTKIYYAALQFTSLGTEFVILFFVLSGFSIAHSLANKSALVPFYSRRLIRLYWPYLIALFWAFAVYKVIAHHSIFNLKESVFDNTSNILSNLFYIPKGELIPQFWSLSYEIIFYLLAPLILLNKNTFALSSIVLFSCFGIGLFFEIQHPIHQSILPQFLFRYGVYFIIGILLYQGFSQSHWIDRLRSKFVLFAGVCILIPAMVILKFKLGEANFITPILAAILSVILIVNFLAFDLKQKWLTFLGKMSYTLYITHFATIYLTLYLFKQLGIINVQYTTTWYIWLIGILIAVVVAIPLYYLGEKPTKTLLQKMRSKR